MPGSAARMSRNGDSTMSRCIRRKSSGSNSAIGLTRWMPALLTRMSTSSETSSSAAVSARSIEPGLAADLVGDRLGDGIDVVVGDDHVRAARRELAHAREADAARAAGDERALAREICSVMRSRAFRCCVGCGVRGASALSMNRIMSSNTCRVEHRRAACRRHRAPTAGSACRSARPCPSAPRR